MHLIAPRPQPRATSHEGSPKKQVGGTSKSGCGEVRGHDEVIVGGAGVRSSSSCWLAYTAVAN